MAMFDTRWSGETKPYTHYKHTAHVPLLLTTPIPWQQQPEQQPSAIVASLTITKQEQWLNKNI